MNRWVPGCKDIRSPAPWRINIQSSELVNPTIRSSDHDAMYQTSLRTWRIRCLILLRGVYEKVKQKRYKVQVLSGFASDEAGFSVFNLRTTEYMKYISQQREREMVLYLDSRPLGLRAPAWPEALHFSKMPLLPLPPSWQMHPLGCRGNDDGPADRRLCNLGSGITSRQRWVSTEQQSRFVQI